jgi:hypothetical protein
MRCPPGLDVAQAPYRQVNIGQRRAKENKTRSTTFVYVEVSTWKLLGNITVVLAAQSCF